MGSPILAAGAAKTPARLISAVLLAAATWASAQGAALLPATQSAPQPPVVIAPTPQSTIPAMPPYLTVTPSDPDTDSLTVTFYGRPLSAPVGPDFTLIEIPDTQYYSASMNGGSPAIFVAQAQWIAANRVDRNIAYVAHVGDIVQHTDDVAAEWVAADTCMRPLEDPDATLRPEGIPFGVSPGSHDIAGTGATFYYSQYFGVSRFQGRSYYGGHFGSNNDSWFELFSASGLDFIVIGFKLMWTQDQAVVHWADSLLTAYPNRRAIVVSHYLLDPGPPVTFSPQGQAIYNGLKSHTNLILMICGHNVNDARRSDTYNGHTIHTVMSNYQNLPHGGDGWLRIMEFSPANNQIRMRTYSPWLTQFRVLPDSSSQFTLPCDLSGGDGGFHPIGTFRKVASGSSVSIPWAGLLRDHSYQWYVTVSDGTSTVTGPTWEFETVDGVPPSVEVVAPNGGEVVGSDQPTAITWNASDPSGVGEVDLILSRSGPAGPWETLVEQVPNTGSYPWWVGGAPTDNAYLRVIAYDAFYNWAMDSSDGPFTIVATTGVEDGPAGALALEPVAPNPMRGPGRVAVILPGPGRIRLDILDVGGREVVALANGFEPAGRREFAWDGRTARGLAPAGLYIARLESSGRVLTRKFVVAR